MTVVGHPDEFRFNKSDLEDHILRREIVLDFPGIVSMNSSSTAIECIEAGLINILRTTGHGDIALIFTKGGFLCRVTVSHYRKVSQSA